MRLSLLNPIRIFRKKMTPPSDFEKNMAVLIQKSEEAMQELSKESFNSDTLKTLCMPDFKPQKPNRLMAVSTRTPNSPVEVCYRRIQDNDVVSIDIFTKGDDEILLGKKQYFMTTDNNGNMIMLSGSMSSDEEACKKNWCKRDWYVRKNFTNKRCYKQWNK